MRARRQVRPTRDVSGVVKVGSGADFLYYNVELHTVTGSVRVCVCLARTLLNVQRLRKWSVGELALLQFLQMGVPPEFGLPRTVLWRECVHLLGADAIVAKLHELTGYMHDARDVARGMQDLHAHLHNNKVYVAQTMLPLVILPPCMTEHDLNTARVFEIPYLHQLACCNVIHPFKANIQLK